MNREIKLPTQQKPKSTFDYTPFELSQIDAFQNSNRGFIEDDEREFIDWEDEA